MVITSTFFLSKLLLVHFFLTLEGIFFYYYYYFHFVYFCTVSTEFIFRVSTEVQRGLRSARLGPPVTAHRAWSLSLPPVLCGQGAPSQR